jgi:hypothetical protein
MPNPRAEMPGVRHFCLRSKIGGRRGRRACRRRVEPISPVLSESADRDGVALRSPLDLSLLCLRKEFAT